MGRKLFIGGLAWATTEDSLRDYFAQQGTVEDAIIIKDKMTGRSRGFGFVTMSSDDECKSAVEAFDGQEFEGRTLKVNEAIEKERR